MATPITADDVKGFLLELGYTIPAALLTPILNKVNAIIACMDAAGYDDDTQRLILLYAAALVSSSSGARRVKSESAPSGASHSFEYGSDGIEGLKRSLAALDVNGCASGLPITAGSPVGFFDVVGGC